MPGASAEQFRFTKPTDLATEARVKAHIPASLPDKKSLLTAIDAGLGFPDYFGFNWDALDECLHDLSWLPTGRIVVAHEDLPLESDAKGREIYLAILADVAAHWADDGERELVVEFPQSCERTVDQILRGSG